MWLFSKERVLKHYTSCDELPIYNFYQAIATGDTSWLLKKKSGKVKVDLTSVLDAIFNEYVEKSDNDQINERIKKRSWIISNSLKLKVCTVMLDRVINGIEVEMYTNELSKWRIKFDLSKDINTQIDAAIQYLSVLKSKLKEAVTDIEKGSEGKDVDLESEAIMLGKIIELPYKINTKKTTVSEWLALNKTAKNKK